MKNLLVRLAREGMSQKKMAACIAVGIYLSIFPVFGVTTLLCALAAFAFRLNLPLIQLVNYAAYPLQIFLLVPFYSAGSWLFGDRLPIDAGTQLIVALRDDLWGSMLQLWDVILYAIGVWALIGPVVIVLLYSLFKPAVGKMQLAVQQAQSARDLANTPERG